MGRGKDCRGKKKKQEKRQPTRKMYHVVVLKYVSYLLRQQVFGGLHHYGLGRECIIMQERVNAPPSINLQI